MLRRYSVLLIVLSAAQLLCAQSFEYKWQRVRMDSVYESSVLYGVDSAVAARQEEMAPLMKVVIYSKEEIGKGQPESALADIAADMLISAARPFIDNSYPVMSLTNLGGIRNSFPKGAVRVYDIYSTFPFDNYVVVAVLKGSDIRRILDGFVSRDKFEALGGVRIVVEDGEMSSCLVGGAPLEDDALYNVVTIDFLLDGGDRFAIGEYAVSVNRTGVIMRDAAVKYLEDLSESGVVLDDRGDGRITVKED